MTDLRNFCYRLWPSLAGLMDAFLLHRRGLLNRWRTAETHVHESMDANVIWCNARRVMTSYCNTRAATFERALRLPARIQIRLVPARMASYKVQIRPKTPHLPPGVYRPGPRSSCVHTRHAAFFRTPDRTFSQ